MHSVITEYKNFFLYLCNDLLQDTADGDHVKDRLRDQLLDLQEQNDKMEGLMHFLEVDKKRLQDKVEAMTQAGEM